MKETVINMTTSYGKLLNNKHLITMTAFSRMNPFIGTPGFRYCKHYNVDNTNISSNVAEVREISKKSHGSHTNNKSLTCKTDDIDSQDNDKKLIDEKTLTKKKNVEVSSSELLIEKNMSMNDAALPDKEKPPDLPTTCCMSGCNNCVWIEYAEELARYYGDGGVKAQDAIRKIPDLNLRAFLEMKLKLR